MATDAGPIATDVRDIDVREAVRSRSQYARVLHRNDPDTVRPRPACSQAGADKRADWRVVDIERHHGFVRLCQNPACFGGDQS